jgi:NDP-sugar pyrophosphorylase family protein
MAPVQGRPFLAYLLDLLRSQGFADFVLCIGYRHEVIQAHFGTGANLGIAIRYSVETEPLGTGGALWAARELLGATFLVLNGDTYLDTDYRRLIQAHRDRPATLTLGLVRVPDAGRYGTVTLEPDGYVTRFAEKSPADPGPGLVNAGIYVGSAALFAEFPPQRPLSLEREVFPRLVARRLLRGIVAPGEMIDIGTPDSYQQFLAQRPGEV